MTLLLGPPASGKTTLLQALAGTLNSTLQASGEVTYNGYKFDEFVPQKSAAYIGEKDVHVPAMTVRETLDFSARCQGVRAADYELLKELSVREKAARILPDAEIDLFMKATSVEGVKHSLQTEYIIKILGLDICADTLVGDQMRRGISGGQKKRLTTGEVIVGPTKVLFMDETSTGLDSSTTYQIVKCLQQTVHLGEATILMSLLQPTPETFNLFDDIILLSEGRIVYQGPREYILDFFEFCGFRCPERKSTPDFLQEVISHKDQAQYWAYHTQPHRYVTIQEFADHFYQFHIGLNLKIELLVPFDKTKNHHAALVFKKHVVPFSELLTSSFANEWLLLRRNLFLYVFKSIQIILIACILSTVFLRTRTQADTISDGFLYNGALLFGMMCNLYHCFVEISLITARLPTFYKQRDLLFYPAWTFTLPIVFVRIPISMLESTFWVVITYRIIGFTPEASRFFKQLLVIFMLQQVVYGIYRTIAGLCRTMILSSFAGTLSLFFFSIVGGFFLPKDLIPKYWMWGYWVSPLTYGYIALCVNEFSAPRWMNKSAPGKSIGLEVLESIDVFPEKKWYWIGVGVLLGSAIIFNVFFTLALTYLKPMESPQAVISDAKASSLEANIEMRETLKVMNADNDSSPQALPTNDGLNFGDNKREMLGLQRKGHSYESIDASRSSLPKRGMVLPFTPLAVSFRDVNYFIDKPQDIKNQGEAKHRTQLLKDITGAFRPGNLTALMGVSGAGKTTLLDILAGRKNVGHIKGEIRISGYPKKQATFTRVLGYCEQNDIHSPQITVNESLVYSAFLRLPMNVNNEEKMKFIDEVMELVELTNLKGAIVGLPDVSGLSTEQRKRLTIAVELVANPSVIFMDEPTTGLDAKAAAIVMRTVRNIVGTGRTIVCTIHQPSIDIFESFDELLLLKRGQIIYSGPLGRNSQKLIEYFEAIPAVPKIKEKENPATWMLAITSNATKDHQKIDFAEYYQSSNLYQLNRELVIALSKPAPESEDLYFPSEYSQTIYTQFKICVWKHWWTYWRSPHYNFVRLLFTFLTSLFLGSMFWKIGEKRDDADDLRIIIGSMILSSQFTGVTNCSTVQPVVSTERTVFYRERGAAMYSVIPYAIANVVVEIPYVLLQSLQFTAVAYSMMSFEWSAEKFFWFFFITFSTYLYFTYYGMMTVSISPNHQVAAVISSAFFSIFSLFSGFYIPKPMIAKGWIWYYWICPLAWTVYGFIVSQFGDVDALIRVPGQADQPINLYVKEHFGYDRDFMGVVGVVLVSFSILFAFVFVFCIRSLNFQRR